MWKVIVLIAISVEFVFGQRNQGWAITGHPLAFFRPCDDNDNLTVIFESGLPPEEENQYILRLNEDFNSNSKATLRFDSDASLTLQGTKLAARISAQPHRQHSVDVDFFKPASLLSVKVKGTRLGSVPYLTSAVVNSVEYCEKPKTGYLDNYILGYKNTAELSTAIPDDSCGRRKVQHTELIVSGLPTKPGDWPWHAAIYRFERSRIEYICGGTLLSHSFVLTAAHCVTSTGAVVLPETRNVVLGKYNLVGGDIAPQEREVHQIIVHEDFNHTNVDNDIALLKLKSEAAFGDYVQPACVWYSGAYKKLPPGTIHGTVVGWGFNQNDSLSSTLQQATIPKLSETTCIKSNPYFYSTLLNSQKFCAGTKNGTSACNGDSGGGFVVFVPDESGNTARNATGAWYLRGIISITVSRSDAPICDPNQYVIFTDVAKYKGWLKSKMT